MTEHTALPPKMSLVNVGLGQLQWWTYNEYKNGIRAGHFVGPAFNPPHPGFVLTACNCHADLLEALRISIERGFSLGYECQSDLELYKRITGEDYEEQS